MNPIIEVKNLKKRFKDFWALKGIDLEIPPGTFVSVLGPNGAGKTTLLEILEGLQKPTEGVVKLFQREWTKENEKFLKQKIGLCLQETRFIDKLTVREIMMVFSSIYDVSESRVDEVIDLLNLNDKKDTYTENLSGGQKQRLALAISILHEPELLFLDEPTTGLDPEARKNIWDVLLYFKKTNKTIILTTHYMEEAQNLSDYIYLINQGKIVAQGTLNQILQQYGKFVSLVFHYDQMALSQKQKLHRLLQKDQELFQFQLFEHEKKIKLVLKETKQLMEIIENWIAKLKKLRLNLYDLEIHRPNLNDVFLYLTGTNLKQENE
jgi:ABC-2 type transport system ATP-binding protein